MLALLLIMVKSLTESVNYNSVKLIMFTSQLQKGNEPGYAGSCMGHIIKNCDFHHHRFTSFKSIHALKKSELHFDAFPISKHLKAFNVQNFIAIAFLCAYTGHASIS